MSHATQSARARSQYPYVFDYTQFLTKESDEPIGSGGYANVYQYSYRGELYAVKELKRLPDHLAAHLTLPEMAVRECDIWRQLRHPNILQLEGIYFPRPDTDIPCFVTRWMENGSIDRYVRRRANRPEPNYLSLIEDIAEGVKYLHDNDIIHEDLRAANILISDDKRALVTDFGIAKYDSGNGVTVSSAFQGNCRWMPCEFFHYQNGDPSHRRSRASDVWMFGMLILEILSGKIPYHECQNSYLIPRMIVEGNLPAFPPAQHDSWRKFDDHVREIASRCWASEPKDRPTIASVLDDIKHLKIIFPEASPSDSSISSSSSSALAEVGNSTGAYSFASSSEGDENTIRLSEYFSSLNLSRNSSASNTTDSTTGASSSRRSNTPTRMSQEALNGPETTIPGRTRTQSAWNRSPDPERSFAREERSTPTPTYVPIDVHIELNNYIARMGFGSRFTEDHYPTGPDEMKTWHCIMKLDGEVIGTAKARQIKVAKKEAAKMALTRLYNETKPSTKPSPLSTSSAPSTPSTPSESDTYRKEGPPHNLTWIYTLCDNGRTVEGRGKTKQEARQNARLQFTLPHGHT